MNDAPGAVWRRGWLDMLMLMLYSPTAGEREL
jgi:hypothetical protein